MNAIDELELREMVRDLHPDELYELVDELPEAVAQVLLDEFGSLGAFHDLPITPLEQAKVLVEGFAERPHLRYLSDRIAQAVEDVERGEERKLIIEMPPRSGKSLLATQVTPAWCLSQHPSWPILVTSYSSQLATSWGRQVRRWVTQGAMGSHLRIADDAGAASDWETTEGGALRSRSIREGLTGYGAKVLIIDDPHKDFTDAHSKISRDEVWNWWTSVAQTRLQPPSLIIVIMTRWHEDDLVGRLLSREFDGDPDDWEVIRVPALAEEGDVLGREVDEPLISPLIEETLEEANRRWAQVKRNVGSYAWSALYQQRPSPAEGAIFSPDSWRYWTTDPSLVSEDGRCVLVSFEELAGGHWVDSWDATFKATKTSDYVVGQRWVRQGANRYLIAQKRARLDFVETIAEMKKWAEPSSHGGTGQYVHERLVEDKANGPAILATLQEQISGLKAINPTTSKEARARAITPEVESGNVYLPHPSMPGYGWVTDLISELRNFPNDAHDDQVDALSQALTRLRTVAGSGINIPGLPSPTAQTSQQGGMVLGMQGALEGARLAAARTLSRRV